MNNIKNFFDRVSMLDNRPGKDLIMPAHEAKMLRDEIAKLMADKLTDRQSPAPRTIEQVIISGGSFK